MTNTSIVDRIMVKQSSTDELSKVIKEDFAIFNKQRNSLDFKMVDLEKKMIDMGASKMNLKDGEESFKNMENRLKTESKINT